MDDEILLVSLVYILGPIYFVYRLDRLNRHL